MRDTREQPVTSHQASLQQFDHHTRKSKLINNPFTPYPYTHYLPYLIPHRPVNLSTPAVYLSTCLPPTVNCLFSFSALFTIKSLPSFVVDNNLPPFCHPQHPCIPCLVTPHCALAAPDNIDTPFTLTVVPHPHPPPRNYTSIHPQKHPTRTDGHAVVWPVVFCFTSDCQPIHPRILSVPTSLSATRTVKSWSNTRVTSRTSSSRVGRPTRAYPVLGNNRSGARTLSIPSRTLVVHMQ